MGTAIPMYATFLTLNTYGADRTFFDDTIAVVVGLLTFVPLVSVDVVPKTLAAKFAVPVTLNMAYPGLSASNSCSDRSWRSWCHLSIR